MYKVKWCKPNMFQVKWNFHRRANNLSPTLAHVYIFARFQSRTLDISISVISEANNRVWLKVLILHNSNWFCWFTSHRSVCSAAGSCVWYWFSLTSLHPPGLMQFRSSQAQDLIVSGGLAPLRYLDDQGQPTDEYPLNPNGSPQGIAGLCSKDGRHLAMMPHPERCTLGWQWPWAPRDFRPSLTPSPWLRMFRNAAAWCSSTGS